MKGSAPNWSMIGSHTEVTKKFSPNFCLGNAELAHNSHTSAAVISTTVAAKIMVISRAISSPSRNLAKNEREPDMGPALFMAVVVVATFLRQNYWMLLMAFFSFSTTSLGSFAYERDSTWFWPSLSIHFRKPLMASRFPAS